MITHLSACLSTVIWPLVSLLCQISNWLSQWTTFHSFIPDISIALLQVLYYSEALPTTALYCIVSIHLYCASCSAHQSEVLPVRETQGEESIDTVVELRRQSATGNCELRTCPRSLRGYVVAGVGFEPATLSVCRMRAKARTE